MQMIAGGGSARDQGSASSWGRTSDGGQFDLSYESYRLKDKFREACQAGASECNPDVKICFSRIRA